jgi:hypothetical protein
MDVRATIQTDDNALIFIAWTGLIHCNKEQSERLTKGEVLKENDCYLMAVPTFETKSEKYGWLNGTQAVGKMVSIKAGEGGFVRYEVFALK